MTKTTEVALFGDKETMPAHLQTGSGLGNENVGVGDRAMPRLNVLQALSPQCETVPGARAGMLHNSITDELYDSVMVLNLYYDKTWSVFKRRELGGGFEGEFTTPSAAADRVSQLSGHAADYDVNETAKHVCLLLDKEGNPVQPVILLLSGTKLRVSNAWNTEIALKSQGADRFASVWKLGTVKQSNSKGSWYNLDVEFAGWAPAALYEAAKEFYTAAKKAA